MAYGPIRAVSPPGDRGATTMPGSSEPFTEPDPGLVEGPHVLREYALLADGERGRWWARAGTWRGCVLPGGTRTGCSRRCSAARASIWCSRGSGSCGAASTSPVADLAQPVDHYLGGRWNAAKRWRSPATCNAWCCCAACSLSIARPGCGWCWILGRGSDGTGCGSCAATMVDSGTPGWVSCSCGGAVAPPRGSPKTTRTTRAHPGW